MERNVLLQSRVGSPKFSNNSKRVRSAMCANGEHDNYGRRRQSGTNPNCLFLPDLHSLDLFKGQPAPRSIINPGGGRAGMAGDPLRDLDDAARIHVFGDARRTEAVTTNSFQDPACPRPFLDQLQDTSTIQASLFNRFTILAEDGKSEALGSDTRYERSSQRSTASLAFECTGTSCSFPRSLGSVTSACRHVRSNRQPSG
jgi:hypothetical protein